MSAFASGLVAVGLVLSEAWFAVGSEILEETKVRSVQLMLVSSLFAVALFAVASALSDGVKEDRDAALRLIADWRQPEWPSIILIGCFTEISLWFSIASEVYISATDTLAIFPLPSTLTSAVLAYLLCSDVPSVGTCVGCLLSLTGVLLVTHPSFIFAQKTLSVYGVILCALGAVTGSIKNVIVMQLSGLNIPNGVLTQIRVIIGASVIVLLFTGAICVSYVWPSPILEVSLWNTANDSICAWQMTALLLSVAAAYTLEIYVLTAVVADLGAVVCSVLFASAPAPAFLMEVALSRDTESPLSLCGVALCIGGSIVSVMSRVKKRTVEDNCEYEPIDNELNA